MNYNLVIRYIINNKYYNKYYNYLISNNNIKYNNKILYKILLSVKQLKEEHPKEVHSVSELSTFFQASYPFLSSDEAETAQVLFEDAEKADVDESLVDKLFDSFIKQQQAHQIAETAIEVTQGRVEWEKLVSILSTQEEVNTEEQDFISTDIVSIYDEENAVKGLKFRLNTLNKILGSLHLGDFGFIFARPEVGKTTFLASEVTFLGMQTEQPVLWINNEQRGSAVISRCYSALFGVSEEEIRKDLANYNARWKEAFGHKFKFVDNPTISRGRIDSLCRSIKPGLIVFDQLDKVHGFVAERHDLLMKAKYQWARELAKQYGPVIGVCQAGGSAENKRYLEMTDVDSSMTAKQGEADWIIGIGRTNDSGLQRIRYLSVCKNKLPHEEGMIMDMRHAKTEVLINEITARYEDKIKWK